MAEHGLVDGRRVIGVAFDGTGYGDDGASWGGEFLVADYRGYERAAHLAYVALPGGDAGVRNPCRMALSHLRSAGLDWDPSVPSVRACGDTELGLLDRQLETGLRCAPTSSMGRLFDAVASLAGICHRIGYDAQAAMELEAAARPWGSRSTGYRFGEHGDPGAGRGGRRGRRTRGGRSRAGRRAVPARRRRPRGGHRAAAARGDRRRHGHAQRRGLPQRVPHRGVRGGRSRPTASRCSRTTWSRPATPGIALGQLAVLAHRPHHHLGRNRRSHVPSGSRTGPGDRGAGRHPDRAGGLRRRDQGGVPRVRARPAGRRVHDRARRLRAAAPRRAVGARDARAVPADG